MELKREARARPWQSLAFPVCVCVCEEVELKMEASARPWQRLAFPV